MARREAIGVDEIHLGKGKRANNSLTVIHQIGSHCRRCRGRR